MLQKTSRFLRFIRTTARNSPWLVIAVALHLILLISLAFVQLSSKNKTIDLPKEIRVVSKAPVDVAPVPVEPPIERHPIPQNTDTTFAPPDEFYFPSAIPDAEDPFAPTGNDDPAINPGEVRPGSTSIGMGPDGGFRGTPGATRVGGSPFKGREGHGGIRGQNRGQVTPLELSVLEGLTWLARHQKDDGSWSPVDMEERCTHGAPCIGKELAVTANYDEGLTGLALLAFLGAGVGTDSKHRIADTAMGTQYRVGDVVFGAVRWLMQRQRPDGSFTEKGFLYNEAIACMAMCEAYGLKHNRTLREPASKSVAYLLRAQRRRLDDGTLWGWRYASAERIEADHAAGLLDDEQFAAKMLDVDLSATCWAIMALKSAQLAGIEVPDSAMRGGLAFAESVATEDGRAGYTDREGAGKKVFGPGDQFVYHPGTMTALDMLTRTFVAHDLRDPFLEAGARQLLKDLPSVSKDHLSVDYYYWYYATLALNQFDGPDSPRKSGKFWTPWNVAMVGAVLGMQDNNQARGACSRGGWLVDDRWSSAGHAIYNTALNTLTLEVYYRYENAFGANVDKLDTRGTDSKFALPSAAQDR